MTAIMIALAVVGLIWGTLFLLRGSLVVGCLVYLLLLCCFGLYFLKIDVGPTLTLDRIWLVILAGVYFVQRRLGAAQPKGLTRVDLVLGMFAGLLTISTVYQKLQGNGLEDSETPIVMHLCNGYLFPLVLYWIARQAPANERMLHTTMTVLTLFGVYLAITGIAEYLGAWAIVFPKYIADPKLGLHFGRARGPMVQSVSFGLYVGVCWMASWLWALRVSRFGRLCLWGLTPLFVAALLCDLTRSTWLGAGLAAMVVLASELRGNWRPLVLGGIAAAGLCVALLKSESILTLERGDNSASQTLESAHLRKSFIFVSWQMFQDRPLFGFGFGQFTHEKLPYLADRSTDLRLEPIRNWIHHNTFLSVLTEAGAIGLILYVSLLVGWGLWGWSLARNRLLNDTTRHTGLLLVATIATYSVQAFCHEVSFSPLDNSLLFFVAGLAMNAALSPHPTMVDRRESTQPASALASSLAAPVAAH